MDFFLGFIAALGFNYAPVGWRYCNGDLVNINTNSALFALLGTTYGGNGQTTFALPDLRGRTLVGMGQGPGLSPYMQGQISGVENTTLLIGNMPAHNHTAVLTADNSAGNNSSPAGNRLASSPKTGSGPNATTLNTYTNASGTPVSMAGQSVTIGVNGGSQPFSILQPYLAINYSIAIQGIFPSRY